VTGFFDRYAPYLSSSVFDRRYRKRTAAAMAEMHSGDGGGRNLMSKGFVTTNCISYAGGFYVLDFGSKDSQVVS
jgi:hypothetical protein